MTKPTNDQAMAGYAVATKYGVYESRAFDLVDEMLEALQLESKHIVIERDSLGQIDRVLIKNASGILKEVS